MERFINILIVDEDDKNRRGLKAILGGGGNNVLTCDTWEEAITIVAAKEVGILLVNIDCPSFGGIQTFKKIKEHSLVENSYMLAISKDNYAGVKMIKGFHEGAIDYITRPYHPNLVQAKIEVYKSLYFKDQRIHQLLRNIFPQNVLSELNKHGKFPPQRVENGVVLFTDFVNFSQKSSKVKPMQLLKKLEHYFTHFDSITARYNLEKIKTIGDSYMVLAGVTEHNPEAALRACLVALEIRNFMLNEMAIAKALKHDYWEIRIGLHMGPLVAGIIGNSKYSFDVWGDTVNIASRAEHSALPNTITITKAVAEEVENYFLMSSRGEIEIKKRGGFIEMFELKRLKEEFSFYNESRIASSELLKQCHLFGIDFDHLRSDILNLIKSNLPDEIIYHDLTHTLNVEKAALRYAKMEGLSAEDTLLLNTGVLFHDIGYILVYEDNEDVAIALAKKELPKYGYSEQQITIVTDIINSTKIEAPKNSLLEQIMCDADHDYFGRADYYSVSSKLREEIENFHGKISDQAWIEKQIHYLEHKHAYYTETAINTRDFGKQLRIHELKNELKKLTK